MYIDPSCFATEAEIKAFYLGMVRAVKAFPYWKDGVPYLDAWGEVTLAEELAALAREETLMLARHRDRQKARES